MKAEISVTSSDVGKAFNRFKNCSSPGREKIQANCWKSLTSVHGKLAKVYENMTKNPENLLSWLIIGKTLLLPKAIDPRYASKFRPLTCLLVISKGFTSILVTTIREHIISNELIPSEQKGNSTNSKGSTINS